MGLTNHEEIWNNCLTVIRNNVSHQNFKIWFEPIIPVSIKILYKQFKYQNYDFLYEMVIINAYYITLLKKTINQLSLIKQKLEYHIVLTIKFS